nr:YggS family pyridoxal phosphate-dependent enzyme [Bacteroidota bacterium]
MIDRIQLAERYERVKATIPGDVKLIAVSKKRTVEEIKALYDLGHRAFGESYPQELRDKHSLLPPDIEWHFIGNLQSNKVKYVVPAATLVHTVDDMQILNVLNERARSINARVAVLFQVHIAREKTKHGFSPIELEEFFNDRSMDRWPFILPKGLMGMATNTTDRDLIRQEFRSLRSVLDKVSASFGDDSQQFKELSMGMSSDAGIAIQEGSTMVRIGTAIFGE